MLQKDGMSFLEVRELFQEVLDDFPDFHHYLADNAKDIVENPLFEKQLFASAKVYPRVENRNKLLPGC